MKIPYSIHQSSKLHKHQSSKLRTAAAKYCTYCTFEHKSESEVLVSTVHTFKHKAEDIPSDFGQPNVLSSSECIVARSQPCSRAAVDMIFATWWVCVELVSSSFTV